MVSAPVRSVTVMIVLLNEHLMCAKRLWVYLVDAPNTTAKKDVQKHYDIFLKYLRDIYNLENVWIKTKMEDDSITPTYLVE